jgi:hypothetical protein
MLDFVLGRAAMLSASSGKEKAVLRAEGLIYGSGLEDLDDGDDSNDVPRSLQLLSNSNGTIGMPIEEPQDPKQTRKLGARCAQAKPDCGVVHDTFSSLWGGIKDLVEEVQDKIKEDRIAWNKLDTEFKAQLETLNSEKGILEDENLKTLADRGAPAQEKDEKKLRS